MTPDGTAPGVSAAVCAAVWDSLGRRVPAVPDGGLVAVFLDAGGEVVLRVVLDEGTRHVDDLFLRHLTALIAEIDAASVVLASVRSGGQPRRADRLLWREMQQRLVDAHSVLADLLIVGEDRCWSAAGRRRWRPAVPALPG
jgi:DNA repair protein RadC